MIALLPLALDVGLVRSLPAAQYPYGLTVDGVDVIAKVGAESVRITEAGAGGVSSMSFTVSDADSSVQISDGAEVRMHDYLRDIPLFLGYVERRSWTPWATGGRTIDVGAYGVEALLDATTIPVMTRSWVDSVEPDATRLHYTEVLQVIAALAGLRTGMPPDLLGVSTAEMPVANSLLYSLPFGVDVVMDGMTVRNAHEAYLAVASDSTGNEGTVPPPIFLTVDFLRGVRSWAWLDPDQWGAAMPGFPSDWTTLSVVDAMTGSVRASNLTYTVDTSPGALTNAVYVDGLTDAGSGWVVGDTRTGRHQGATTAQTTDIAGKYTAANAILSGKARPAGRGSFTLEHFTPIDAHPGGRLQLTDVAMPWYDADWHPWGGIQECVITQIDKRFPDWDGKQDWTVTFVAVLHGPSAGRASSMSSARTYTRGTKN